MGVNETKLKYALDRTRDIILNLSMECDHTIMWRQERGMKPVTDTSMFASAPLSAVIKMQRVFKNIILELDNARN